MMQNQHIVNTTDASLLGLAIASMAGWLPVVIMVFTAVAGIVRLYLMWLDIKLKHKALKEPNAPADSE